MKKGGNRTTNSIRNYSMTVIAQVMSILLSFIGRTFFIKLLSIEYLGVNGLFSNILSLLSLAELGVGTAITYMMYKPIAENDIYKVAAYNNLFRKVYNYIGLFVLIVGIALTPFIHIFIKESPQISENIYIIYILFVCNSAISYFFTYKRSLLIAYQKEYINSQNIVVFAIIKDVVLIGLLYAFRDYYIYLIAQIIVTFASNVTISFKTNKLFPDIVKIKPDNVSIDEKRTIFKNTAAMLCHKIGSVVVSGTGNLFISYFVGIATVGIYSNYVLISTCANQVVGKGVNSLTASFGNLVATAKEEDVFTIFRRIYFLNFVIAFSLALLFYCAIDPFITIWIGSEYLLDTRTLLIIVVNSIFLYQIRVPSQMVINTYGLFWQIKWKSLIEAGVNFCCSFLFAAYFKWGITGILSAALVSNITTSLWWEPYVAFKYGMKQPAKGYWAEFVKNVLLLMMSILILQYGFRYLNLISSNIIAIIFLRIVFTSFFIFFLIWFVYHNKEEYKYAVNVVSKITKNKIV